MAFIHSFICCPPADFELIGLSLSFRIGFLGLGLMGSGIVSNLLKMGHTVTVWNRTSEKVSIHSGARRAGGMEP